MAMIRNRPHTDDGAPVMEWARTELLRVRPAGATRPGGGS
jgi:hypothetical protein